MPARRGLWCPLDTSGPTSAGPGPECTGSGPPSQADLCSSEGGTRSKHGCQHAVGRSSPGHGYAVQGARLVEENGGSDPILGFLHACLDAGAPSREPPARGHVLSRLTTQWSVEDEEEAARERRRRERDRQLRAQDEDGDGQSPEQPEQEKLPHQHGPGNEDGDKLSPAGVSLEELRLSHGSEPQDETEPRGPEGTSQGLAEAEEAEEQHQKCQQPRAPSPLVLEETTEQGSPPLSPSIKLSDRTESLNRSIKKSNSVKKSQPALPISKIDERLEQYTQAIETAGRTPKLARQPSIELPSMAVASTKSRWETGEVQAQSAAKAPSCKDIVAGDMSKKSLWEQTSGSKTSSTVKSTPSGKRYKFVATGHGKYEKVLVDEGSAP
ncbi:lymphocyte-specific protein 1 isoform X2 [Equus quagga]|uniref:lymphocyte-specific protein 1 isoform X2 n=1 Tax=Equus quagga TaxID=89248 RepID=UPI001EE2FC9B|nr:lymphocyte-specific protein 1 isoform X2 [Equus quagga]